MGRVAAERNLSAVVPLVAESRSCRGGHRDYRVSHPATEGSRITAAGSWSGCSLSLASVKRFLHRYGLITVCLGVLFASGIAAGYRWGQHHTARAVVPATDSPDLTPEQWGENAAAALQKDLDLSAEQTDNVRGSIAGPARQIFEEKQRGNLKIHLRLLEAHDTLARDAGLTDKQKALLKVRREQLREHIIEKFKSILGDQQEPILSGL